MSGPTGECVHGPGCGHQLDLTKEHIHTGDDCCKTQLLTEIKVTHEVAGAAEWDAVGLVDPVGGGAIVAYTNSVVPVTVALNHGGVSGEPSFQPQVLIRTGVTERGEVTYVGSPAIDAQRYSGGPDPSSFTVAGGAINAGVSARSSMAVIEGLAQTSQHDSAVHGAGGGMRAVATTASRAPSSSGGVAFAQSAPSTGAEAAVNQAGAALQGYQPRVSASYGISDRSTVASLDGTGVISQQYSRGGEFNQFKVAGLQTIGVPATWGASAAGINPGQPSQQRSVGYGAVSERDTVAGSVGTTSSATVSSSITPSSGAVASSQQARTWTAGASSTFGAPNPPGPSPADSSAVSRPLQRQIALREEPQAAVSSSRTVESPAMRAATGELRSPRSASVSGLESTPSARVNLEESRGGARRFDGAAADRQAQSRYAREKAESSESRAELQKRADTPFRQTEAQTAAVRSERFMGWASERTTAVKTTGPSESSPSPMGQGVRLPGPSAEVRSQGTARENNSPNRATGERRDTRVTAATERESPGRVRPQPDNSQFKREARNLDGAQAAAVQRGLTRDTPSARNAAGNTLSRERAPGSQERVPRRESGSQERAGARREVSGNSRGVGESRVLRDLARNGDRATGRPVNTVQPDRLSKRSDVTTRSAEPRVRVERVTRMSRSGVQGREVLKLRAAALRQAILERINRIVATAEQRLRRSNNTSLSSIRQLDLVTRVIEVLGEEEYEAISELRSRDRNPSSGTRIARRRKMPKTQDVDQKKLRLKSLKALKKQRAARVAGAGASTSQSGASQGAGGVTAGASSAPSTVPGKIVSASRGGPSKSLDIFQAKSDDSEAPPND